MLEDNAIYRGYLACTKGPVPDLVRRRGKVRYTVLDDVWDPESGKKVTVSRLEEIDQVTSLPNGWTLWPRNLLSASDGYPQVEIDEAGALGLQDLAARRRKAGRLLNRSAPIALRPGPQTEAYEALVNNDHNGSVVLAPGKGKTVLALRAAQDLGLPALVILENSGLMQQWRGEAATFLGLAGSDTGIVRGPVEKWTWERPFVVASYKSLLIQADLGAVPDDFWRWWGLVVWDEAHHCQAPELSRTLSMFPCRRIALTATPHVCGREAIYFNHVGWPVYRDVTPDIYPEISVHGIEMPNRVLDSVNPKSKESYGKMLAATLTASAKTRRQFYLDAVAESLSQMMEAGRTVLVISPRVAAMHYLSQKMRETYSHDSVVVSEAVPFDSRIAAYRSEDLVFVSRKIGTEALDRKELDTVVFLTPVGKSHSGEVAIQQGAGRGTRAMTGKDRAYFHIFYPDSAYGRHLVLANIRAAEAMGFTRSPDRSVDDLVEKESAAEKAAQVKRAEDRKKTHRRAAATFARIVGSVSTKPSTR
jgi:superfamily II DNA or RNA helicase